MSKIDGTDVRIAQVVGGRDTRSDASDAWPRRTPEGPAPGAADVVLRPDRAGGAVASSVDDLDLMTVEEVCALLKVRKWFVYDAVSSGRLVAVKLGRSLRFRRRDIARFIDGGLTAAS